HHRRAEAAMTIAAHREPLPFDFGELTIAGDRVVEYREKPVRHPLASSGTYVLSHAAVECIERNESLGAPALFERVNRRGLRVAAYEHDGLWIDVNDRVSVERAEILLASRDGPTQ
ncbi:MAG TPA: hypothetical protein VKB39_12120, partial [Candidatus Baltobacteraceae bacterium]|nr:hypothetical protein [Candidatus Baltobacteraceae bacterium]